MVQAGQWLKQRREQLGLTQEQLARRMAAVSHGLGEAIPPPAKSTMSCWETNKRTPNPFYALLLCRALDSSPDELGLGGVLTPDRVAELAAARKRVSFLQAAARSPEWPGGHALRWLTDPPGFPTAEMGIGAERCDLDRLNSTMLAMQRVDRRTVDDQWTLTRHYVDAMLPLQSRSHLGLITEHLLRLRNLRSITDNDGLRHELGVMICESAICAGVDLTTLTDYGLAMEANRYAAELAGELAEPSLRSVALIMQAQLYGGRLHPRLIPVPSRMRQLIEDALSLSAGASPEARVVVYATAAHLQSQFGREPAARRGIELAQRAEADMGRNARPYCGLTSPGFRLALEGAVEEALGHPDRAIPLLTEAIERTDPSWRWHGQEAWLLFALATCYANTGAIELAAPRASTALRAARRHEATFLIRGIEGFAEGLRAQVPHHPAVQQLGEELDRSA